jgi:hypothetical protein
MKIVPIIDDPEPILYTVQYLNEEKDELDKAFDEWMDPEFLKQFFEENSEDLEAYNKFHGAHYTTDEAALNTIDDAFDFQDLLYEAADPGNKSGLKKLQDLFEPLHNYENEYYLLQKSKAKNSWLRFYAIRIEENLYVITGGCIKLTQKMKERTHTDLEMKKIDQVKRYLKNKGLINKKAFKELEIGI